MSEQFEDFTRPQESKEKRMCSSCGEEMRIERKTQTLTDEDIGSLFDDGKSEPVPVSAHNHNEVTTKYLCKCGHSESVGSVECPECEKEEKDKKI